MNNILQNNIELQSITEELDNKLIIAGINTANANAVAADLIRGKTAYVNGEKIIGDIPTHYGGYFMPSSSDQILVPSKYYLQDSVILHGDDNLKAENIRAGVKLFDVMGKYEGKDGEPWMLVNAYDARVANHPEYGQGFISQADGSYRSDRIFGYDSTACRVYFTVHAFCNIKFNVTSVLQYTSDYSVFSKLDTTFPAPVDDESPAAHLIYKRFSTNTTEDLIYYNVTPGEHFIDVRFHMNAGGYATHESWLEFTICPMEGIQPETIQRILSLTPHLTPSNIRAGVNILGVEGEFNPIANEMGILEKTLTSYTNNYILQLPSYAFAYATKLQDVQFNDLQTVGNYAFASCTALQSIILPNCITIQSGAFNSCTNLTTVQLPNCSSIGTAAFNSCSRLTTIQLPNCSAIGGSAFAYCSSLQTIDLPNCITLNTQTFTYCYNLLQVSIPKVDTIGTYAFSNCSALRSINAPLCTTVSHYAFQYCRQLYSAILPECVDIGTTAFSFCTQLMDVQLPKCPTIGQYTFYQCSALQSIYLPACTRVSHYAFGQCSNLTNVSLPACTYVDSRAFQQCGMSTIYLPMLKTLSSYTFESCSKLLSVDCPMCTYVYRAFSYCSSLAFVTLGSTLQSDSTYTPIIYSSAFQNCSKLETLNLYYNSIATLSNTGVFAGTPMSNSTYISKFGSIYVPASLVDAYKSATNWTTYANRITALPKE